MPRGVSKMVSISFNVKSVEKSVIPGVYLLSGENDQGQKITVEYSGKLGLSYKEGETLSLNLGKRGITPTSDKDYCGRAFLYSIKESGRKKIYLLSVGGFIIRIETPRKIKGLDVAEEYSFCISST
jgi:hypothetical protein